MVKKHNEAECPSELLKLYAVNNFSQLVYKRKIKKRKEKKEKEKKSGRALFYIE